MYLLYFPSQLYESQIFLIGKLVGLISIVFKPIKKTHRNSILGID